MTEGMPEPIPAADGGEVLDAPAHAVGGRVEKTGLALVHEGEWITPTPESLAAITPGTAAGQVINFYFPVEIEVIGDLSQEQVERVANFVFEAIETELSSRA